MEELLTCSVCIERYCENGRHPVLLPRCGHSFCRSCIAMLVSGGCVICPTCRMDQRIDSADRLPTEFTLLAIISAQESNKKETCERHFVKLSFWCRTCSMATCGECLFEDHPTHNHEVIRATKYINDMKLNAQDVANKFMEVLDDREQSYYKIIFDHAKKISKALCGINVIRKDMEEARELMKGIKEDDSISAATSLSEASKFLGLKWNIQDANFSQEQKEEKEKEEQKKKEQIEDTGAIEAAAKAKREEEEEEELQQKKARKEARRLLRKSRTMSSVEFLREAEKLNLKDVIPKDLEPLLAETQNGDISEVMRAIKDESALKTAEITKELEAKEKQKEVEKEDTVVKPKGRFLTRKSPSLVKKPEPKTLPPGAGLPVIQENEAEKGTTVEPTANSEPDGEKCSQQTEEVKNELESKPREKETLLEASAKEIEILPKKESEALDSKYAEALTTKGNETLSLKDTEAATKEILELTTKEILELATKEIQELATKEEPKAEAIKEEELKEESKLCDFIQVPGFMVSVESTDGRLSGMEWGPQGLHVHCLQYNHVSYDIVIKSNLLSSLIPSKNPIAFIELTADQTILGRVYIKLWGQLRRAQNFLSLCLGEEGKSFLNTKFLQVYNVNESGERILGGDYEHNNGRGGRGLINDLEWNGDYAMPMKTGMITAAGSGQDATNSLFLLCTQSDPTRNFSCPFGLVCEGLKVIKDAVQQTATKQIWITDCGVVIVPPR